MDYSMFLMKWLINWFRMCSKKSILYLLILHIYILEEIKFFLNVGMPFHKYKSSWKRKTYPTMENFRCIGGNNCNQFYLSTEKWFIGGIMLMEWKLDQMTFYTIGEVRIKLANVRFLLILVVNGSDSKIIMSQSDLLYLNKGQGFIWGNEFGHYSLWKEIY